MNLDRLVEHLSNPAFYPEPTTGVEVIQTHISFIFLTDAHAYKVKKPVDFGFLDYTTLAKRRQMCEREVALNSRLCPDIYLGVIELNESDGSLSIGGPGETVEVAVKMRRLPRERMLRQVLARGEGNEALFERIAVTLADFHRRAPAPRTGEGMSGVERPKFNCDENFAQTEKYIGSLLPRRAFELIRNSTDLFFKRKGGLFARRVEERRIVDGHGDLHLDSICATDPVRIFDCIEFNERFRIQDAAEEVGFLAMDLEFHGYAPFARKFVEAYVAASGDAELLELLAFYKTYRAYVRAKINSFASDDPHIPAAARDASRATASHYYELAAHYAAACNPRRLIVTCGLTGSGKSTLARKLGELYSLQLIRSDVVRKELVGIAPDERRWLPYDQGEYSPEMTDRTYAEMLERAKALLEVGHSVVLDGCYTKRLQRDGAVDLARRLGVPFLLLECRTSEDVIRERLERRAQKAGTVSDGRWEIYHRQLAEFEAPEEIAGDKRVVLDRSKPVDELLHELAVVLPSAWQDVTATSGTRARRGAALQAR
ncbi:MAG TPA: AAA family ATPase [Thermoanaerobaculaceae bacterium]|nr:AAA family ATPase [Thermoanaerobaculaceae bacterium]